MTKIDEMITEAKASMGAGLVFGQPYEKNGVTVIPAVRVMGGVGGGEGQATEGEGDSAKQMPSGYGAGYGMMGRPAGALVVKGEDVKWLPAIDVNRMMLGFQVVAIVFLLVLRSVMNARAKAAG